MAPVLAEANPSTLRQNFAEKCEFLTCKMTKPLEQPLIAGLEMS